MQQTENQQEWETSNALQRRVEGFRAEVSGIWVEMLVGSNGIFPIRML